MFCNNCGQQNPDGVRFCSNCGAPLMADATAQAPVDADATVRVRVQPPVQEQYAPVQQAPAQQYAPVQQAPYQAPVEQYAPVQQASYQAPADPYAVPQYGAPAPQKSNGKMIGIIVGVVAAIAAIVVVLVLVLGGSSSGGASTPEEIAEKYAVASCKMDVDELVDCMADFILLEGSKEAGYDEINKDAVAEQVESAYGSMMDQIGDVDYEVLEVEKDDDWNGKDNILNTIKNQYGSAAADSVSDVCLVNVKLKVNGNETTMPVITVKENGNWRVFGVN